MQNEKLKILGTGLSGLIGTRIVELLSGRYEFEDLSLETGVDITNKDTLLNKVKMSHAPLILHMAAVTDVDGCEKDKDLKERGLCWKVNVEGTENIVEAARKFGKRVLYISTDFVFSGSSFYYDEDSVPDPINWYGVTKFKGEQIVQAGSCEHLVVRLAFPYRAKFEREDIARFFLQKLEAGERVKAVEDWLITPTFIDDIAPALDALIQQNVAGIFHVVGSSSHTPFEMAQMIAETFQLAKSLIEPIKLKELFAGKAPRPWRLVMRNDKIRELGMKMSTFADGLEEMKKQLNI